MYHIFSIEILCEDKVVSPVIRLFLSIVQMCTVSPWSLLSSSDSKPREVAQLDATVRAVSGEHSSIHTSEPVGKFLLRASGGDKAEVRQCCIILFECTVLNFQCHRFCEPAWCRELEDRAKEV